MTLWNMWSWFLKDYRVLTSLFFLEEVMALVHHPTNNIFHNLQKRAASFLIFFPGDFSREYDKDIIFNR